MQADFWHQRWMQGRIAFDQQETNPLLVKYFKKLGLSKRSKVFLPLCGKSLDILWCLESGFDVVAIELSELAVKSLFERLAVEPVITKVGQLSCYSAPYLDVFIGDFFNLTEKELGKVDAIYDRAALVALPKQMRTKYAKHLINISKSAPQLLITFEYDQQLIDGPPFSLNSMELEQLYAIEYRSQLLESIDFPGGLKGKVNALECAWLLTKHPK
jgi:thiopurine S-methyltransferase